MAELLGRDSLVVRKKSNKSKKGYTEVDLIPLIRSWSLECRSDAMALDAVLSAQNPGLNPELIRAAFCEAYPQFAPDFVTFHRREVLDGEGKLLWETALVYGQSVALDGTVPLNFWEKLRWSWYFACRNGYQSYPVYPFG